MTNKSEVNLIILVVEDVHETRDGIEKLLKADGYQVSVARNEQDAIESALLNRPDLILVSLDGLPVEVISTARRIRFRGKTGEAVPVVVFCVEGISDGDEVAVGRNVHITRPDNFNQLRRLIARLLRNTTDSSTGETPNAIQSALPLFLQKPSIGQRTQDEKDASAE